MATLEDFRNRFPEFIDVPENRINLFLGDAELLMADPVRWLSFYDVAHAYHAAHLVYVGLHTQSGDGSVMAPVKRQEVDDVIIEQAIGAVTPTADDLLSSAYGKRYDMYRKICFAGIMGV